MIFEALTARVSTLTYVLEGGELFLGHIAVHTVVPGEGGEGALIAQSGEGLGAKGAGFPSAAGLRSWGYRVGGGLVGGVPANQALLVLAGVGDLFLLTHLFTFPVPYGGGG